MDYRVYRADIRFWMIVILLSCAVGGSAGYLFFDAWWGCLLIPICIPVVQKRLRQSCLQKRTRQLKTEFWEVMTLVSGSISAGYSLENAFVQTYRTSAAEFPLMEAELQILMNGIACHKRIEQLLMALADRSGVGEIRELAAMIEAAKRYGGNIPYLIRQMVRQMQESELVELEIQTVLAAKKLEGRIMLFVPFGIVLFLRMTNASYMQVLYTTATGRLWMGVSLAGIGLCTWWIEKIIRIEV